MDPASVIGLAASIVQLLELPAKTAELIAQWKSNPNLCDRICDDARKIEQHLQQLPRDGSYQYVFDQSQPNLEKVMSILESTKQRPRCSRCPTIITSIWDCLRSSKVRGTLDEAQNLLDKLLNEVILTAVSSVAAAVNEVDHRVPRSAANLPLLPSIDIGFHRVQEILDFLQKKKNGVRVVGIYGQGGLGKTTLLNKTIRELMKGEAFSKSAYVEVREKPDNERVKTLQSSILQQLGGPATEMQTIQHGKAALREHLLKLKDSNKTICLAIDNLWEEADLQQLLPDELASILLSSSCLIITTRFLNVVEKLDQLCSSHSGDQFHKLSYRPDELSPKDSKDLFMKNASKIVPLTDEHLPLVNAIVPLCGGLPLAVEVLGSLFSTESSRESYHWKEVERKLRSDEENLPTGSDPVFKVLQVSYDKLKPNTQKAFLDAAHFFYGWEWHTVRHILGNDEMVELENSSLLTRSAKGVEWAVMQNGHPCREGGMKGETEEATVRIHDLILRLGKDLAEQDHLEYAVNLDSIVHDEPEELKKVRGLWLSNSLEMIDANEAARMQNLRVLHLERSSTEDDRFDMRRLRQLRYLRLSPHFSEQRGSSELFSERRGGDSLRFLSLARIKSSLRGAQLSSQLRELHLHDCPNLVELPQSSSQLKMLERLHIHGCASFSKLPQVCGNWEQLQELVIIGPNRMTDLPACIGNLGSLKLLSLADCGNLVELPSSSSQLKMLERLCIKGCASFSRLPQDCGNWERLQELDITGANLMTELPACIGNLGSLKWLSLADCGNLVELPLSSSQLKKLESLHIKGCASFSGLPENCGNWERLQELGVTGPNRMTELPVYIGSLGSLKLLSLADCGDLVELPSSSSQLKKLESLCIKGCASFSRLPEDCGNWERLQELDITGPNRMTELPASIGNLGSLKVLSLAHCGNLVELPASSSQLKKLESLCIKGCANFSRLPEDCGNWEQLQELDITGPNRMTEIPASIGNLGSLKLFSVAHCHNVVSWPPTFWNLKSLKSLKVERCSSLENLLAVPSCVSQLVIGDCQNLVSVGSPDSGLPVLDEVSLFECSGGLVESILQMRDLNRLRSLKISGCDTLNALPPPIGQLSALEELELTDCKRLRELPEELGCLSSLKNLCLSRCDELLELPEGIGNLTSLRELQVWYCSKLQKLPPTIRNAVSLEKVYLHGCEELLELPEGLGALRCLRTLDLQYCGKLRRLPNVGSQVKLDVTGCEGLELSELPTDRDFRDQLPGWRPPMEAALRFENLEYLEVKVSDNMTESQWIEAGGIVSLQRLVLVDDDGNSLTLPSQAFRLSQLRALEIQGFRSLREWPDDDEVPWSLPLLERLKLEGLENLICLPSQVSSLGNLQSLQLLRCWELEELPPDFNQLGLKRLTLECSSKLCFTNRPQLWPISLNVLHVQLDLQDFSPQIGQLQALEKLALIVSSQQYEIEFSGTDDEDFSCEVIRKVQSKRSPVFASLPGHIGDLLALKELHLIGLEGLRDLPAEIGKLSNLETLHLIGLEGLRHLPAEIGKLTRLRWLELRECRSLRGLPGEGIGQLLILSWLELENCDALESLPSEIGRLTKLGILKLRWCGSLQELPSEVGNLVDLQYLDVSGCTSLRSLPSSLANLIQLEYVLVGWCPGLRHINLPIPPGCSNVYKDEKLVTWKTRAFGVVACQELFKRRSLEWRW